VARISGIGGKIELINRSSSAQQINGSLNDENLEPVDGKVVNIVDISEIQHQIDALVTKTNELFSFASSVNSNLQKEISKRLSDVESLLTKLNSEANIRQETDEEIYSQLSNRINTVAASISSFLTRLSTEISERKDADNALKQDINVVSIDLNNKLREEAETRANKDAQLSQGLEEEISSRQEADTAIYAYIDNETKELVGIIKSLEIYLKKLLDKKVDKVTGKGLSTNDFTNKLKNKLDNIEAEAQVNTIESISVNGIHQRVDEDKNVNIEVPVRVSELSNDRGYALQSDIVENYATRVWVKDQKYISEVFWDDIPDKPELKEVATTGNYDDLINKPVIPEAQVNSDWNATSGIAEILNKPVLAKVATTGSYKDLKNKPTLGTAASKNVGNLAGNVVVLDSNGKISSDILPPTAITEVYEASSQAAMLALPATRGSICVRSDLNKSFILSSTPASVLSNWKELQTPQDTVLSVNGKIGVVNLSAQDIGALPSNTQYVSAVKSLDTTLTYAQTPDANESLSGTSVIALHKISKTGDYNDLLNRPTIPDAQIQADWAQTNSSAKDFIKNKPAIPTVSVVDVLVNGRSAIGEDKKARIRVPVTTSDLTNDSDFVSKTWVQTQNYLTQADIDAKQDKLNFNPEVPEGVETVPLTIIQDADTYYKVDATESEIRTGEIVDFIFEANKEITYTSTIDSNCVLTIPSTIDTGFISLLTILSMPANKTITIQKEDQEIPFNIRIVSGNTALPGNTYVTSISGKKIIFARCDGADIEILFIEELEA